MEKVDACLVRWILKEARWIWVQVLPNQEGVPWWWEWEGEKVKCIWVNQVVVNPYFDSIQKRKSRSLKMNCKRKSLTKSLKIFAMMQHLEFKKTKSWKTKRKNLSSIKLTKNKREELMSLTTQQLWVVSRIPNKIWNNISINMKKQRIRICK